MSADIHRRLSRRKVPVLLVGGVDEAAMLVTAMSLQIGLPDAVTVRHTIDPGRQLLTRTVSDATGILEEEGIDLAHACVTCAIREDIVPTLERLAGSGRWTSIVACLPIAAEAIQVCRALGWAPRNAPHVTIAAVITALDGASVAEDLLGEDLLDERGLATSEDDRRGVAEVACAMVEYADAITLTQPTSDEEASLVQALARPRVLMVDDPSLVDADVLVAGVHRHQAVEAWIADVRYGALPSLPNDSVWRMDLSSDRPFHPGRFYDELATLGGGARRSRGCFWLPTRPGDICAWDSAGGQASVGCTDAWAPGQARVTRIIVTGIDDLVDEQDEIRAAFHRCLLTDEELAERGLRWDESWDGLEPWLGPIHRVA